MELRQQINNLRALKFSYASIRLDHMTLLFNYLYLINLLVLFPYIRCVHLHTHLLATINVKRK